MNLRTKSALPSEFLSYARMELLLIEYAAVQEALTAFRAEFKAIASLEEACLPV